MGDGQVSVIRKIKNSPAKSGVAGFWAFRLVDFGRKPKRYGNGKIVVVFIDFGYNANAASVIIDAKFQVEICWNIFRNDQRNLPGFACANGNRVPGLRSC